MSSSSRGAMVWRESRSGSLRQRSGTPRDARFWISAWLPVLIGIAIIVCESTPAFGADRTSGPLRRIFEALFGHVSDAHWDTIHHIIRKSGHFIGYGLLGLAWMRAWWMSLPRYRSMTSVFLAVLGTGLVATWDEWHQSFLPNRSSSPWDVLLDCCGAISACGIAYVFILMFRAPRMR